jgi:hypothetical protein
LSQTVASTTVSGTCGVVSYANTTTAAQTVGGNLFVTPVGFLACDGSVYNRSAYPDLASYSGYQPSVSAYTLVSSAGATAVFSAGTQGMFSANGFLLLNNTIDQSTFANTVVTAALRYSSNGVSWTSLNGYVATDFVYNNGVYAYMPFQYTSGAVGIVYGSSLAAMTTKGTAATLGLYVSSRGYLAAGGTSNVFVATFLICVDTKHVDFLVLGLGFLLVLF